ncbi:hypothetical protein U1Q18_025004 [Sarracenia purpurea var. burkii]
MLGVAASPVGYQALSSVKVIHNKQTGQPEGYGFIEFINRAAAERVLQTYNGTLMPNSEQNFRPNWATLGAGERHADEGLDYTIFVRDLAADVSDYLLLETFKAHYPSIKGVKFVTDRVTGRTKGYGFVKFADESEQLRAMTEINGMVCSSRPMRIGPAATKKPTGGGQQYPKEERWPSTAAKADGESYAMRSRDLLVTLVLPFSGSESTKKVFDFSQSTSGFTIAIMNNQFFDVSYKIFPRISRMKRSQPVVKGMEVVSHDLREALFEFNLELHHGGGSTRLNN